MVTASACCRSGIASKAALAASRVPFHPDKDLATKRFGVCRIWNDQERTPKPQDETLQEIKFDAETLASINLAGDDQIRGHAMLNDGVRHKWRLATDPCTIQMPDQSGAFEFQRSPSLGARAA